MLLVYCTGKKIIITVSSYSLPFWDEEILFLHNNIRTLKAFGLFEHGKTFIGRPFSGADRGFCDRGGLEIQYTVAIWAR